MQGIVDALWCAARTGGCFPKRVATHEVARNTGSCTNSSAPDEEPPPFRRFVSGSKAARAGLISLMSMAAVALCAPK
jgi:hypothetical protein